MKRTSLLILPWKELFLGSIAGSPLPLKILTCLFPFLTSLLNLCLPLKTDTTSAKLEKASPTVWSLMNSGRKIVTKIGSLPSLRRPTRLRKLPITPSDSRMRQMSDSRIFLLVSSKSNMWSSNPLSLKAHSRV